MHLRARKIPADSQLDCDICIVGAGAAGTVLAHKLRQSGRKVILLEAGGLKNAEGSMALYEGETSDADFHLPPDRDRARGLGGTSAMWGGRCMPYDPVDFAPRDHIPNSGWPVGMDDLLPWYRQAQTYAQCGDYEYDCHRSGLTGDLVPKLQSDRLLTTSLERWSPPVNFGKSLRADLLAAGNVTLVTGAAAVGLLQDNGSGPVRAVVAKSVRNGQSFTIAARQVVLAGGGLEVARLLMASNKANGQTIGDHSGWLGRGYMCHVGGVISRIRFAPGQEILFGYEADPDGVYVRRRFTLSAEAQISEGLPNIYALLDRPLLSDASHGSASMSLLYLVKRLVQKQSAEEPVAESGRFALYRRHLRNLLFGAPEVLTVLPKFGRDRFLKGRRVPSLLMSSQDNLFYLYFHAEQSPNRDSRVELTGQDDRLGVPRLKVCPKLEDHDVRAIEKAHQVIDTELRASGAGTLEYLAEDTSAAIRACKCTLGHHIGTTRMAKDPQNGVVDATARVHFVPNLYVASSAILPTSSQAHPTLTILAFALRLADHLARTN